MVLPCSVMEGLAAARSNEKTGCFIEEQSITGRRVVAHARGRAPLEAVSKFETGGELHQTRVAAERLIGLAEYAAVRNQVQVRRVAIPELNVVDVPGNILRMVEDVERLRRDLELLALGDGELLLELNVEVVDRFEGHGIAATVGESAGPGDDVAGVGIRRNIGDRTR